MPTPEDGPPLAPLRRYPTLAAARDASLALAAREWVYEIDRAGDGWLLLVQENARAAAEEELRVFEAEQRENRPPPPERFGAFQPLSLLFVATLLLGVFLAQERLAFDVTSAGDADNGAILGGAWWRCFTALTLHADISHIGANLATGALFAGFLIPQFGTGLTWLLVLAAGAAGNFINSWGYRNEPHHSIGASTAVFGALGLLVAAEGVHRWRTPTLGRRWWQVIVPIGGGLALLAFLGVGEKHEPIDFMAHWWGLCSGAALGIPAAWVEARERSNRSLQWAAGLLATALLATAWVLAIRAGP